MTRPGLAHPQACARPLPCHQPPNTAPSLLRGVRTRGSQRTGGADADTVRCAARCRAWGGQAALRLRSCARDGLSGTAALALSCQWEPGAARCGEPCGLCQSLMDIFVSAAGCQGHSVPGFCCRVQHLQLSEVSEPGDALAGAPRPCHTVTETGDGEWGAVAWSHTGSPELGQWVTRRLGLGWESGRGVMAPNTLPAWRGLLASWGALRARSFTNPSAFPAGGKRGWLSRGHGAFALLPPLPCPCSPRIPIRASVGTAGQEAAAAVPEPAARMPGKRLVLRDQSVCAGLVFGRFT